MLCPLFLSLYRGDRGGREEEGSDRGGVEAEEVSGSAAELAGGAAAPGKELDIGC